MPRFDTTIMTARYAGTDATGRAFRKGDTIAWNRRKRVVVASDPAEIERIQGEQTAAAFDMAWEDDCARRCGL